MADFDFRDVISPGNINNAPFPQSIPLDMKLAGKF